jgi:uncharacterized membrane protein YjdF
MMATASKKYRFNDYLEFTLYLLAVLCFGYFLMKGNKAKLFEPVLIIAVLLAIRLLIKKTKVEIIPALRFSILAFIFVAMFLGNEFGFYTIFPLLDKVEHLMSGAILCFVGLTLFFYVNRNEEIKVHPLTIIYFSLFFSTAMAGCWEIYEFSGDQLLGFHSQNNSLIDTMEDIICGTIGAILTSIYLYVKAKDNKLPLAKSNDYILNTDTMIGTSDKGIIK